MTCKALGAICVVLGIFNLGFASVGVPYRWFNAGAALLDFSCACLMFYWVGRKYRGR